MRPRRGGSAGSRSPRAARPAGSETPGRAEGAPAGPRGRRGSRSAATPGKSAPPQGRAGLAGTLARDPHGVRGDAPEGHRHTPTPKLPQRERGSGAKPREGREGTVLTRGSRPERIRDPGRRWWPRSGHRASGYPGHLPQRGAWIRRLRAGRRGRGRVGATDPSCEPRGSAAEPQPQRESGSGLAAGARRRRLRGRRPRRRHPEPARPQPPLTPAGPAAGQSEAPGAGARAGRGRAGRRAPTPARGRGGQPAGPSRAPRARGRHAPGGRGAPGGGGAGAARARAWDPRPLLGAPSRCGAERGPRPRSPPSATSGRPQL